MTRRARTRTLATAIAIFGAALTLSACELAENGLTSTGVTPGADERSADAGPYRVARVVDGDTIVVDVDQEPITVRLIGIDTPETKHPDMGVQCFGPEATAHVEQLLEGRSVWLEEDPTQESVDRYGRRLAYVWLDQTTMLNETLLTGGYAREYTYDVAYTHQERFLQAQDEAQTTSAGLWSPETCDGRTEAS